MVSKKKNKKSQLQMIRPSHWNKNQLNGILAEFRNKRILVIGDVGLDRYTIGVVERISPEAPVPIVLVESEQYKLGLAANVADNIRALGGTPILVGVIGKDRCAADFKDILKQMGIESSHLVVDGTRRTVLKERIVSDKQQLVRVDYESSHSLDQEIERKVLQKFQALLPSVDGVIVEDYAKGLITPSLMEGIQRSLKKSGKMLALDPNLKTPIQTYRGASLLTPNTKEAEFLSGVKIKDPDSLCKAGFYILKSTLAKYVVITLGKQGMAIFSRGSSTVQLIPTYAREVYDVSGAGDTVISTLSLALVSGGNIETASVLGNLAAGVEVGKRGTATVSIEEIRSAMDFFENLR